MPDSALPTMKCVCCHNNTIERKQSIREDCVHKSSAQTDFAFLVCKRCNQGHGIPCVLQFKDRIEKDMPKCITEHCQWYLDVRDMHFRGRKMIYYINRGICCSFKPSFVGDYSVTKVDLPNANQHAITVNDTLNSSSSEDNDVKGDYSRGNESARKLTIESKRISWRKGGEVPPGTLSFLSDYHGVAPFRTKMMLPSNIMKKMKDIMKSSQHGRTTPLQFNNRYSGSLYVPSHNLLVQTQAFNSVLYTDLHGVAFSKIDGTPGLPHAVISESNGKQLSDIMRHRQHPSFFSTAFQEIIVLHNVSSPEDSKLTRSWKIQVITVPQVISTVDVIKRKGCTTFSCEVLSHTLFFGYNQINAKVDVTIILGSLNVNGMSTPKLILMRFHRMISSITSPCQAKSLYHTLRCVSGKNGFELNRVGGSSGLRSEQSDQDFLFVINELPSTLPRKCGACLIIPFQFGYKVLYTKRSKRDGKHRIAICTYSVPRDGGSFRINNSTMKDFPFMGEFSYIKMLGTMILLKINESWKVGSCSFEVAVCPLQNEYRNILMARNCFQASNRCYHTFISNYNNQNSASMVPYNVGLHNDTFNERKESLENKMIVTCPAMKGFGRGGSLFRINNIAQFSYAILDWTATTKSHKSFVDTNRTALEQAGVKGSRMTQQNIRILFQNAPPLYNALRRHEANFALRDRSNAEQTNTRTGTTEITTLTTTISTTPPAATNTAPSQMEMNSERVQRRNTRSAVAQRYQDQSNIEVQQRRQSARVLDLQQLISGTEQYMTPSFRRM